mgnify:CR=1 FL=1
MNKSNHMDAVHMFGSTMTNAEILAAAKEPAQAQVGRDVLTGAGSKHCEAPVPAAGLHKNQP